MSSLDNHHTHDKEHMDDHEGRIEPDEIATTNTNNPLKTHARVTHIEVAPIFSSDRDSQLSAEVTIENTSDFRHSCQIVFRGYVRSKQALVYEFLHEQAWTISEGRGTSSHSVAIDAWLNRFPPTMQISEDVFVEYSVRATVDPWFLNTHLEKIFIVERKLNLKMPHIACRPYKKSVNECVGHGGWCHRKCEPINGELYLEKGGYTYGESVSFKWNLESKTAITEARVALVKEYEFRHADPGHPMLLEYHTEELTAEKKEEAVPKGEILLKVPHKIPSSIEMSLWNVISIKYYVLLQFKTKNTKKYVDFRTPVFIVSEKIQATRHAERDRRTLYKRAHDIDDDSADDDDCDSELEEHHDPHRDQYSIDIEDLRIVVDEGNLSNAYAEVKFVMNSDRPRPLRSIRLLMTGECRAGAVWYDFLRYKAIATTNEERAFSPGQHSIKLALPFLDTQYDTHILPPSLGEDIKYTCRISTKSWRINQLEFQQDFFCSRFVDTWAREEFKSGFSEKIGSFAMTMEQRCFQKGKYIFCKVYGPAVSVKLSLLQERRLRQPGLNVDESYCTQRLVTSHTSAEDKEMWPEEWYLAIPEHIPPSIEMCYWNVVVISYKFTVVTKSQDGHEHVHNVPIWIGCTDDRCGPPKPPVRREPLPHEDPRVASPPLGELPEFEVVKREEVHEHPFWVKRLNDDTYNDYPIV